MNLYFQAIALFLFKTFMFLILLFLIITGIFLITGTTSGKQFADFQKYFATLFYLVVYLATIFFALDYSDNVSRKFCFAIYLFLLIGLPTAFEKFGKLAMLF